VQRVCWRWCLVAALRAEREAERCGVRSAAREQRSGGEVSDMRANTCSASLHAALTARGHSLTRPAATQRERKCWAQRFLFAGPRAGGCVSVSCVQPSSHQQHAGRTLFLLAARPVARSVNPARRCSRLAVCLSALSLPHPAPLRPPPCCRLVAMWSRRRPGSTKHTRCDTAKRN
jgi:hypothetical protein